MNIKDEIRQEQQKILSENRKKEEKAGLEAALSKELFNNGFDSNYPNKIPKLGYPTDERYSIINEALPYLTFSEPKIVREMPDGNVYVRKANEGEAADTYSFDFYYGEHEYGYTPNYICVYIFNNGSIASICNIPERNVDQSKFIGTFGRTLDLKKMIIRAQAQISLDNCSKISSTDTSWYDKTENFPALKIQHHEAEQKHQKAERIKYENERIKLQKEKSIRRKKFMRVIAWIALIIWSILPYLTLMPSYLNNVKVQISREFFYFHSIVYFVIIIFLNHTTVTYDSNVSYVTPKVASCIMGLSSMSMTAGSSIGDHSFDFFFIAIGLIVSNVIGHYANEWLWRFNKTP